MNAESVAQNEAFCRFNNTLAAAANLSITLTLFILSQTTVIHAGNRTALCVTINALLLPCAILYQARSAARRRAVLNALEPAAHRRSGSLNSPQRSSLVRESDGQLDFLHPDHFDRICQAGAYSRQQLLRCAFTWVSEHAFEDPISNYKWGQVVHLLRLLAPLNDEKNGDASLGLSFEQNGVWFYGSVRGDPEETSDCDFEFASVDRPNAAAVIDIIERTISFTAGSARQEVFRYHSTPFIALQTIAYKKERSLTLRMVALRDAMGASSEGRAVLTEVPKKFGEIKQQIDSTLTQALRCGFPRECETIDNASRLDAEVLVPYTQLVADNTLNFFKKKLQRMFPEARVVTNIHEMRPTDIFVILVAPVKRGARVIEKVAAYRDDHRADPTAWPFVQFLGDILRASVVCQNGTGVLTAWNRIASPSAGFDVKDGNGRLSTSSPSINFNLLHRRQVQN